MKNITWVHRSADTEYGYEPLMEAHLFRPLYKIVRTKAPDVAHLYVYKDGIYTYLNNEGSEEEAKHYAEMHFLLTGTSRSETKINYHFDEYKNNINKA